METIDWKNLGFGYSKADFNVRCWYRNGQWGGLEVSDSENVTLHIAATAFHYGQEAFEGLKAFRGKDGKIRVFRMEENAKRMQRSSQGIMLAEVSTALFTEAVRKAVKLNEGYVPPFESGAALYIRPLLIGTGPQIGVKPADEYLFMVMVMPVGPYFKEGFKPTDLVIYREYDRAAPLGTGKIKVGGNYAASLVAGQRAHQNGFSSVLYLDAKEKKYIDECGPANFFGIKGNTYITPKSDSILPSITNMSLMELAKSIGMTVENRPVSVDELKDFNEVGACGTAAVITPIRKIVDPEKNIFYQYCKGTEPGPVCSSLYYKLTAIQFGDDIDEFDWISFVE